MATYRAETETYTFEGETYTRDEVVEAVKELTWQAELAAEDGDTKQVEELVDTVVELLNWLGEVDLATRTWFAYSAAKKGDLDSANEYFDYVATHCATCFF